MKHRADIEGLRGLSVLLVVLAHAGLPGLHGGFIGVDVFFVISGYLITGLLLEELQASGRIDAWRFYARRGRRLLPAFALMLLATLGAAALLLSPVELARHAYEAAWAAGWAANLQQVVADTDYFGTTREAGLFLHAWSLGVEEQFYLVWPVFVWVVWRAAGAEAFLRAVMVVIAVAGFAHAVAATYGDPVGAYFLPQARAWQFACGALAWMWVATGRSPRGAFASALSLAGLASIACAAVLIERDTRYPGFAALAPTLGAALCLVGGAEGHSRASRALGSWAPAALGRVSYSWYLWHWPALVFAAALLPGDPQARVLAVVGSLAVAWIAFRAVEDPIRRGRAAPPRMVALLGVFASLAMVAGCMAIHRAQRASIEPGGTADHPILATIAMPEIYAAGCDQWYHTADLSPCVVDLAPDGAPTVVVIGDSIGVQWFPALADHFRARGWDMVVLTKSACAIVDRPFHYERIRREYTECAAWRASAVDYIERTAPAAVIVGSGGNYPFDMAGWRDGSIDFLRSIAAPGRQLAVLGPTPMLPFDAPACLMRRHAGLPAGPTTPDCAAPLGDVAFHDVEAALRSAVAAVPGAVYVDAAAIACPDGRCAAWNGGQLAFRDNQHLNVGYVLSRSEPLGHALAPIERPIEASRD